MVTRLVLSDAVSKARGLALPAAPVTVKLRARIFTDPVTDPVPANCTRTFVVAPFAGEERRERFVLMLEMATPETPGPIVAPVNWSTLPLYSTTTCPALTCAEVVRATGTDTDEPETPTAEGSERPVDWAHAVPQNSRMTNPKNRNIFTTYLLLVVYASLEIRQHPILCASVCSRTPT